jgi:hypothetical protein
MSVTTAETIRPFTIPVATRAELHDLRARILNTRWPDREPVSDHSQGVQLEVMQELARYWATRTTGASARPGCRRCRTS